MKTFVLACFVTLANASSHVHDAAEDISILSLLQHSVRSIHKTDGDAKPAEVAVDPPPGAVDRIRARRIERRSHPDWKPSAEQLARIKARRAAKRQAHAAGKAAGRRHFGDGGNCDICLAKCEELFNDVFKQCMIDENCRPWQKEDGKPATVCAKRCLKAGEWQRSPCNRNCLCDADELSLYEEKAEISTEVQSHWAGKIHRCRDAPIGEISDCTTIEQDRDSLAHDSIHKCAKAAAEKGADTFNFYRPAKEFGKCDLKNCGSADLKLITPPPEPESPAGRGNWKVFSTYCGKGPENHDDGWGL